MYRMIIAGGRDFNEYDLLKEKLDEHIKDLDEEVVIVSGHANGADKLGERYAFENDLRVQLFLADWENLGKKAGHVRNYDMANFAKEGGKGILVAFWDGESKGTESMIRMAKAKGLTVFVHTY